MKNLAHLAPRALQEELKSLGLADYRTKQIIRWIWKEGVSDFEAMSNLSKDLRQKLSSLYTFKLPKILIAQKSEDGTIKYLIELDDQKTVETVWIPREDQERVTVCVSSQIGCKLGCKFCLTAQQKVERNLEAGEIAAQLLILPEREKITNVVLMGMGEPFDNYDAVMGALEIMTDPEALEIAPRRVTVSTSGLVPRIRQYVQDTKCRLAVSLNAPNDEIRNELMPINKAYPLEKLLGCLKEISKRSFPRALRSNFYVTFEYILMEDVNDRPEHAEQIVHLLKGIPCKINLLFYNENPNIPYKRPGIERVVRFQNVLRAGGFLAFIRSSRGRDISAACGQLASETKRQDMHFPKLPEVNENLKHVHV